MKPRAIAQAFALMYTDKYSPYYDAEKYALNCGYKFNDRQNLAQIL